MATSLSSSRFVSTLSKAPATSEQFTSTFCPASKALTQRRESKARTSLEPLFFVSANWFLPAKVRCKTNGAKVDRMSLSMTYWGVKWIPR